MSKQHLLVVVLIVLAGALTFSVIGQEEPTQPLPIVQAKVSSFGLVDPSLEFQRPSLGEAARRHDYVSFSTVYLEAKARGESVAEFDALYELWTWSMNEPVGAFYGRDVHDRLANAYAGFASYIADYAIVDQRGNTFYPTGETRAFLLERAVAGTPSPRLTLADTRTPPGRAQTEPSAVQRERRRPATQREERSPSQSSTAATQVATAASTTATHTETPAATSPAATSPSITNQAKTNRATTSRATTTPATVTPTIATPAATTAAPISAPTTAVRETPAIAQADDVAAIPEASGSLRNQGILLIVIGLIGIGLLALILRTPQESMSSTIRGPISAAPDKPAAIRGANTAAANKPPAPVEPIRRAQSPAPLTTEEQPRATGSHG